MSRLLDPRTSVQSNASSLFALSGNSSPSSSSGKAGRKVRAQPVASSSQQKGSLIQVVARIRPRLACEEPELDCVEVLPDSKSILLDDGSNRKHYNVDRVFDSRIDDGRQVQVFNHFACSLVADSLKGYNVCVFAYGHTGSGKTYTMLGDCSTKMNHDNPSEAGVLPRFLRSVFQAHSEVGEAVPGWGYTCQFFEVYHERINDLLAADKIGQACSSTRELQVHAHPKHGVLVENLTTAVVNSAEEALDLLNLGKEMRAVGTTTMNEHSSRSHAIFTFRSEPLDTETLSRCQSTITFVDLAGKEERLSSQPRAMQLPEMCFINASLFYLGHLVAKLTQGQIDKGQYECNGPDFRNCKLTLLLSQALVGNSRTALIATLTPLRSYYEETVSTMVFAQSVAKLKTSPSVNNKSYKSVILELDGEARKLQRELDESKVGFFQQQIHQRNLENEETEQALQTAQAFIAHYTGSWLEKAARSEEAALSRKSMIERAGLLHTVSSSNASPALPTFMNGEIVPFLTKLSDDPSLQGCCNFSLSKHTLVIGGDASTSDIVLQGVGITATMCKIECQEDGSVTVSIICSGPSDATSVPRVLVCGKALSPDSYPFASMRHSDCLILGYAHAFRLVAPAKQQLEELRGIEVHDVVSRSLADLDIVSAVSEIMDETGSQFKSVFSYIEGLNLPQRSLDSILEALHSLCPLVDEANVITRQVLREDDVRFELRALTNLFDAQKETPILVVCVLTAPRGVSSPRNNVASWALPSYKDTALESTRKKRDPMARARSLSDQMKVGTGDFLSHAWPIEKFMSRLAEIRDVYHEGLQAGDNFMAVRHRLAQKPLLNPWRDVNADDLKSSTEAGSFKGGLGRRQRYRTMSDDKLFGEAHMSPSLPASPSEPRTSVVSSAPSERRTSLTNPLARTSSRRTSSSSAKQVSPKRGVKPASPKKTPMQQEREAKADSVATTASSVAKPPDTLPEKEQAKAILTLPVTSRAKAHAPAGAVSGETLSDGSAENSLKQCAAWLEKTRPTTSSTGKPPLPDASVKDSFGRESLGQGIPGTVPGAEEGRASGTRTPPATAAALVSNVLHVETRDRASSGESAKKSVQAARRDSRLSYSDSLMSYMGRRMSHRESVNMGTMCDSMLSKMKNLEHLFEQWQQPEQSGVSSLGLDIAQDIISPESSMSLGRRRGSTMSTDSPRTAALMTAMKDMTSYFEKLASGDESGISSDESDDKDKIETPSISLTPQPSSVSKTLGADDAKPCCLDEGGQNGSLHPPLQIDTAMQRGTGLQIDTAMQRGTGTPKSYDDPDSPRVIASLKQMKARIGSFCSELERRDSEVAVLTEDRERLSAVLGNLLMDSNEPSTGGRHSEGRIFCRQEQLESLLQLLERLCNQLDHLQPYMHHGRNALPHHTAGPLSWRSISPDIFIQDSAQVPQNPSTTSQPVATSLMSSRSSSPSPLAGGTHTFTAPTWPHVVSARPRESSPQPQNATVIPGSPRGVWPRGPHRSGVASPLAARVVPAWCEAPTLLADGLPSQGNPSNRLVGSPRQGTRRLGKSAYLQAGGDTASALIFRPNSISSLASTCTTTFSTPAQSMIASVGDAQPMDRHLLTGSATFSKRPTSAPVLLRSVHPGSPRCGRPLSPALSRNALGQGIPMPVQASPGVSNRHNRITMASEKPALQAASGNQLQGPARNMTRKEPAALPAHENVRKLSGLGQEGQSALSPADS